MFVQHLRKPGWLPSEHSSRTVWPLLLELGTWLRLTVPLSNPPSSCVSSLRLFCVSLWVSEPKHFIPRWRQSIWVNTKLFTLDTGFQVLAMSRSWSVTRLRSVISAGWYFAWLFEFYWTRTAAHLTCTSVFCVLLRWVCLSGLCVCVWESWSEIKLHTSTH